MANTRRRDPIGRHANQTDNDGTKASQRVEHLRRSFAKFRRGHPLRTTIPQTLRDEALAAMSGGVPELIVRRACRISPEQLYWWRKAQRSGQQGSESRRPKARVFPVVDNTAAIAFPSVTGQQPPDLEFRVGGWIVCIRQHQG